MATADHSTTAQRTTWANKMFDARDNHAGFRCIELALGDKFLYVVGKLGGMHEFQKFIADLASISDDNDAALYLNENGIKLAY